MHYVLSTRSREILRQFAVSRVALAFDFDGTLAPIVSDPEQAYMRQTTHLLLSKLAGIRTCLVISGRSRADLRSKLSGTGIHHLIGNHGAEPWEGAEPVRRKVRQWESALQKELLNLPGLWIENKRLSLTIHYRQCRRKTDAHSAVMEAARLLPGVRLIGGKEAISIVSKSAPNKGAALIAHLARLNCDRALYVGDDETDEDVFALKDVVPTLVTIRVGRKNSSQAGYFLRSQTEMDELLRLLIRVASGS